MKTERRGSLYRWMLFLFVILLTVLLFYFRNRIPNLGRYGYPGIFIISILTNATVIVPLPGVFFTSAMGVVFNPFWVAIAAGSGATIGELSGYLAGFSGQRVFEKIDWHEKIEDLMRKYGGIVIFVLAFIPNPAFDAAGITAGALKMPVLKFLLWCWLGKILKMLMFAFGGSIIGGWFRAPP
ncbi:MAG: VTT domain-containing protein [Anaerolineaceae bacterium]|nr:VTT domain-containing protein [Anaerolineaceae bacterium]